MHTTKRASAYAVILLFCLTVAGYGSGLTRGLSNVRDGSNVASHSVTGAIQVCAWALDTVSILGRVANRYDTIDLGLREDTVVRRADATDGPVLILTGNLEGLANDLAYDRVGTWECVAHYRSDDSSVPIYVEVDGEPT